MFKVGDKVLSLATRHTLAKMDTAYVDHGELGTVLEAYNCDPRPVYFCIFPGCCDYFLEGELELDGHDYELS